MSEENRNDNYNIHPYQTGDWINVSFERNKYMFLKDSRYGTGGYKHGKYLVPHKRENQNDYNLRRSKAFFNNQYQAILNAHYKPIFKNRAVRVIDESTPQAYRDIYDVFLMDADGKGNGLQRTMETAAGCAKNLGAAFLVINNDIDVDSTIEDVLESRSGVPYVFIVTPDIINEYTTDSFGNLTSIEWYQQDGEKTFSRYGYEGAGSNGFPSSPNNDASNDDDIIIVGVDFDSWYIRKGAEKMVIADNSLGVLPVVRLVEDENDAIIPEPSLYSVARMQHRLYNLDSIITDIQDNQAFSIFTMPVQGGSGVEFSTSKGLSYPMESSNKPEFISPDASQLKELREGEAHLENSMYKAGVVSHLQRFQQSAESKEIDRARLNDLLGTFKSQIESAEEQLMYIFGLYVDYDYEYKVAYSDDFGVSTLGEVTARFVELDQANISNAVRTRLEKMLSMDLFEFEDEEEKQDFLDQIDLERQQALNQELIDNQF